MNRKPTRDEMFAQALRAALYDARRSESILCESPSEVFSNALESISQVATELETIAAAEGPTDGELLMFVMENTDAGERVGPLHTVRWFDLATGEEREMSAPSYKEAILAAMQVSEAEAGAPDPAEVSGG
jgi:hypothetical protein